MKYELQVNQFLDAVIVFLLGAIVFSIGGVLTQVFGVMMFGISLCMMIGLSGRCLFMWYDTTHNKQGDL